MPALDGERDAEYTLVAASEIDNLRAGDESDPRARSLDVGSLWAANTSAALYVYVELPFFDLNTVAGEWCLAFHLRGVNDGISRSGAFGDPYGASVDLGHSPAANAILKSNMRGYAADYDGNQGWAFLNPVNTARTDWIWSNSNLFGDTGWQSDRASGEVRGSGRTGAGVVYKAGRGLEMRIPLALFPGGAGTAITAPRMGDTLWMQFYDNVRERTPPLYPRGPIDCVPFEPASRTNSSRGTVSLWASYTLSDFRITRVDLRNAADINHLVVRYSSPVGTGGFDAANYTVTNESTGASLPVLAAAQDGADPSIVVLTLAVPFHARLRVSTRNVRGNNGLTLSGPSSVVMRTPPGILFSLHDEYGAIDALGNDPATGRPYRITVTGDPIAWRSDPDGATEIGMEPVPNQPGRYRSPPVFAGPGIVSYKYRVPALSAWDNWNALNPKDRRWYVPDGALIVETRDEAAGVVDGTGHYGTRQASFTLIDLEGFAQGRGVYLTGDFTGWSANPSSMVAMRPIDGQAGSYRAEFTLPVGFGAGIASRYRYVLASDAAEGSGFDRNALNPLGDRWTLLAASGNPSMVRVRDSVGGYRFTRIMRVLAGLDAVPGWSDYTVDLDTNGDGTVTLADAMDVSRPARMPRLRAAGTRIVDDQGRETALRGTNLGGWFVEEMWMTPWATDPPSGSSYGKVEDHVSLWRTLEQRLGPAGAADVRTAYRQAWFQEQDFARLRAAGFNHVRLPFLYSLIEEPGGMDWLRAAVRDANRAGLYVILDMHGAPGGQNPWDHSGEVGRNAFFADMANVSRAAEIWRSIAREFGSLPGVAAFDLMNEPAGAPSPTILHQVHNTLYQAIRSVAPSTMIVIEDGYKGFNTMPTPGQYGWTNVIYSTHLYTFSATNPKDHLNSLNAQLPELLAIRDARAVPLYIGEFNLEPHNAPDALVDYTRTLTDSGCAWAVWTAKTVAKSGTLGYWGLWSNPVPVDPLDPFVDSAATLIAKVRQVRTENLTMPSGLDGVYKEP